MTSRGSSRRVSASADSVDAARICAWLIVVLLVPRIVRMLYPEIWVEDDFYLESAWLVSVGMRPYLDFVQPHMPLLEWIAAGYLKLFGASYLSIEFLNEAAIFATSLLTYALARRVAGRPAAIAASILYAYSSLVFRYHAYERESFVAPLLVLAAIVTLDDTMPRAAPSRDSCRNFLPRVRNQADRRDRVPRDAGVHRGRIPPNRGRSCVRRNLRARARRRSARSSTGFTAASSSSRRSCFIF